MKITFSDALVSLRPTSNWIAREDSLEWLDYTQTQPTEAEIQAEIIRLQAEYDAKEYQRKRAAEYPPITDFADAYYWAQKGKTDLMDAYVAKCDAIKLKYPK